jgi:hypothetical protein
MFEALPTPLPLFFFFFFFFVRVSMLAPNCAASLCLLYSQLMRRAKRRTVADKAKAGGATADKAAMMPWALLLNRGGNPGQRNGLRTGALPEVGEWARAVPVGSVNSQIGLAGYWVLIGRNGGV